MFSIYPLILPCMIFLHIVDDYYLQGKLASLKQRSWWEENYPDKIYSFDYIVALITHAFSWSFMILIPIILTTTKIIDNSIINEYSIPILGMIILNTWIHASIDNLKCNKYKINLLTDQILHLIQIVITWGLYVMFL